MPAKEKVKPIKTTKKEVDNATVDLESAETRVDLSDAIEELGNNNFNALYNAPVEKYLKDKTGKKAEYLPWSMAWAMFKHYRPDASYIYEPDRYFDNGEVEVVVSVTTQGQTYQSILPVLDNKNQPRRNPNRFAVNTARQRCLTKAIAMHGLGLTCWNSVAIKEIEDFGDEATGSATPAETETQDNSIPSNQKAKLPSDTYESLQAKLADGSGTLKAANDYMRDKGYSPTEEQLEGLIKAESDYKQGVLNEIN
jgi:hypothetical protein